jgi:hypothetical protein
MPKAEHDRLLMLLADRFLAEAAAQGFSADQLLAHLVNRLRKGNEAYVITDDSKD